MSNMLGDQYAKCIRKKTMGLYGAQLKAIELDEMES